MLEKKIREILEKDVESLGCSIWGIEISGGAFSKNIIIYIDKKNELISLQIVNKLIFKQGKYWKIFPTLILILV